MAPCLGIAMISSLGAVDLLNEDFSVDDGGFRQMDDTSAVSFVVRCQVDP